MARIIGVVCIVLAACGGNDSGPDQQAAAMYFDVYDALQMLEQQALAAQPFAPVVQTIDYSGPCTLGGTSALHGTYDDAGTPPTYAFDATFTGCVTSNATLDGGVSWTGTGSSTGASSMFSETTNGTLAYTGQIYAGTFGFHDLTVTTTVTDTTATVTVTGTYSIGGTTYTVDSKTWASYFGG